MSYSERLEELGVSILSIVVMHGDLSESRSSVLELLDQFDTDGAASTRQCNLFEKRVPNQSKVAIDIKNPDPEKVTDKKVISFSGSEIGRAHV